MEDFHNISIENDTDGLEPYLSTTFFVTSCIVSSIGLPLTLLAIYALYSLVQENNVAPVYVINLLISDLIQMCCFVIWVAQPKNLIMFVVSGIIHSIGLMASVGFMVCVAMERYLVITCPLWYRFRRNIKITLVVCFTVWVLPLILGFLSYFILKFLQPHILLSIYLLVPFPLLIFFLAGTLKALSSSISVPLEEKRRIVGTLVLVLLNYTLLFLPTIIWYMSAAITENSAFDHTLQIIFVQFSPLMDLVLYIFMKKGAVDKLLACLCRCRMTTEQEQG
ncbi:mas-related G-protein coupled receptor member A4-like [Myripristis murdjan]|uniref:Mas-related G-protein coupled receptor member A4-like n=1 Tax=Myripristis murdjan TaxID=586833 RepID=A0A668AAC9_9TELE|nr:mas-related G-protein coupled receptor member A4-like [Myripristis murdjan]